MTRKRPVDIDLSQIDDTNLGSTPSLPDQYLSEPGETIQEDRDEWSDTWLFEQYRSRVNKDRDIKIGIVAEDAETGVAKSTLALYLAIRMDRNGFTAEKVGFDGERVLELLDLDDGVEYGSAVIADEIQKMVDARRSTSSINVTLTQAMAMARFRQAYFLYTLPEWHMVDSRVRKQTDILIVCKNEPNVGEAIVYDVLTDDLNAGTAKTKRMETISFPDITGNDIYKRMEEIKEDSFRDLIQSYGDDEEDQTDTEPSQKEKAKSKVKELKQNDPNLSVRDIRNHQDVPRSPKGNSDKWSTSTISNWINEIEDIE